MHNPNLSFAKIVATPTDTAWSQVYNAGSLFLVVSLHTSSPLEDNALNSLGKQVINNLEAEFFTLETKDLPAIKSAVTTSLQELSDSITVSLSLAYVKDTILYLLIVGAGKVIMKRADKLGSILESEQTERTIVTASGYLANEDTILLQTGQFSHLITETVLAQAFELSLPSDIAETLSPTVHAAENGGASAIVIHFKGITHTPVTKVVAAPADSTTIATSYSETTITVSDEEKTDQPQPKTSRFAGLSRLRYGKKLPFPLPRLKLGNMRTKIFIVLAVVIAVVLLGSIYKTVKQQQQTKNTAAFHQIYDAAQKDYDDGTGLLSLNPAFARDDFQAAKTKLEAGLPKFPADSPEAKQLTDLLAKVNSQLGTAATTNTVTPTAANTSDAPTLAAVLADKKVLFATQDDALYTLTASGVTKDGKSIITNKSDWTAVSGFAAYHGNLYILDKKAGILKYVASTDGYSQSDYFSDAKPDLSLSTGMAIDGSVWIVMADGRILKYTKGQAESFSVKGMDKLFNRPSSIVTDVDSTNLYILDSGNNRLVVVSKDGNFKKSYSAAAFANARAIAVNEKTSTVYFLSQDKLLKIAL